MTRWVPDKNFPLTIPNYRYVKLKLETAILARQLKPRYFLLEVAKAIAGPVAVLAARGRSTEKSRVVIRCCKATTVPSVGQQREGAARSAKLPSSGPAESAKVGKIPVQLGSSTPAACPHPAICAGSGSD